MKTPPMPESEQRIPPTLCGVAFILLAAASLYSELPVLSSLVSLSFGASVIYFNATEELLPEHRRGTQYHRNVDAIGVVCILLAIFMATLGYS